MAKNLRNPSKPGIFLTSSSTSCFSERYHCTELVYCRCMMLNKDNCNCCYSLSVTKSNRRQQPVMFVEVPNYSVCFTGFSKACYSSFSSNWSV